MTTLCDVIDNCTECPRYADDCDGDKRIEPTDYISRADALRQQFLKYGASMCKGGEKE